MNNQITRAFEILLAKNTISNIDSKRVMSLLAKLDTEGLIDRKQAEQIIFSQTSDSEAALRAFISRINSAINLLSKQQDLIKEEEDLFRKMELKSLRQTKRIAAQLQFVAPFFSINQIPHKNRNYDDKVYQDLKVDQITNTKINHSFKVFISYAEKDFRAVNQFKKLLTQGNHKIKGKPIEVFSMTSLIVGQSFNEQIREEIKKCDLGIICISYYLFKSEYIKEVEIPLLSDKVLIPIGLDKNIPSKDNLNFFQYIANKFTDQSHADLINREIYLLNKDSPQKLFLTDCGASLEPAFIKGLLQEIKKRLAKKSQSQFKNIAKNSIRDSRNYPVDKYENLDGERQNFKQSTHRDIEQQQKLDKNKDNQSSTVMLLDDMHDWLKSNQNQYGIYLILGDYGMGKTFTCRVFAEELIEQKNLALEVVYLDLRNVNTWVEENNGEKMIKRQPTLEEMIAQILRYNENDSDIDAKKVIDYAREGKALIIFDGLDEKCVHYSNEMQNQFLNEILRIFPNDKTREQSKVKLVLSCRTHFFASLVEQNQFLQQLGRGDSKTEDFRAVKICSLNPVQIKSLLKKQLGDRSEQLINLINEEHFLKDLATRPYLLNLIAETSAELVQLKHKGIALNSASIYQTLINQVLLRDEGKHELLKADKQSLLAQLAMYFWLEGEQLLPVDELNDWYQKWLFADELLKQKYLSGSNEENLKRLKVLEQDLRNSSLLLRFNDHDFGFSHSSMQEYFFAVWLSYQLQILGDDNKSINSQLLNIAKQKQQAPSKETQQFLADYLFLQRDKLKNKINQGIAKILANSELSAAWQKWFIDLISLLSQNNYPTFECQAVYLQGIENSQNKWEIKGLKTQQLFLTNSHLRNTYFIDCQIDQLDLTKRLHLEDILFKRCTIEAIKTDTQSMSEKLVKELTFAQCNLSSEVKNQIKQSKQIYTIDHNKSIDKVAINQSNMPKWFIQNHYAGDIYSICFSPDNNYLASAGTDNTIKLWDNKVASKNYGNCVKTLTGHQGAVFSICFSPDNNYLASAGRDRTIKLWDNKVASKNYGNCVKTLTGHQGSIRSICFSPDNNYLASAGDDNTIKLWDNKVASKNYGNCVKTLTGHQDWIHSICFSPDNNYLASAGYDNTIKLWDNKVASKNYGNCIKTLTGHQDWIHSICFSPDNNYLASAGEDKTIKLWDNKVASKNYGNCIKTLTGHQGSVFSICFSPDNNYLASAGRDRTIKLWDNKVASKNYGNCVKTLTGHQDWIRSICFSPDNNYLASAGEDNTIKLWDNKVASKNYGNCVKTLTGHQDWIRSICFSPDNNYLASAGTDNTIKLWDNKVASKNYGNCVKTLIEHKGWINSICFSPDGNYLASAGRDRTIKLWDNQVASKNYGNCVKTLTGHQGSVFSICFSPDNNYLASAGYDNTIKLWDNKVASKNYGNCIKTLTGHQGSVFSICFSPDNNYLASAGRDRTIKLWDNKVASKNYGNCVKTLTGHQDWIDSICFSPDGNYLASAGRNRTIKLWDNQVASKNYGNCVKTLTGHQDWIRSICFSPDGNYLASAGRNRTIKLWDNQVASKNYGNCVKTLTGHQGAVFSICFSPDNNYLASCGIEGIRLFKDHEQEVGLFFSLQEDFATIFYDQDHNIQSIKATEMAHCALNLSDGKNTLAIDQHPNFIYVSSER